MEREAWARAWRFLSYSPVAKWTAICTAVGTGVFYAALLVVLCLFAELIVYKGRIPAFRELPQARQERFRHEWDTLEKDQREQRLHAVGVNNPAAVTALTEAAFAELPPAEQAFLWRTEVLQIVKQRVGDEAAALVLPTYWELPPRVREHRAAASASEAFESTLSDRGALALVVRSEDRLYGRLAGWLARHNTWTWRAGNAGSLTGLFFLAVVLALVRALLLFGMTYAAARASIEAATRLRRSVYHHTFRLGTLAFRPTGPNEAVSIFTRHLEAVHDALYTWLTVVCREPVKFVLLLALALAVHFWLGLAFLLFAVLVWLVGGQAAAYFRRQGRVAMRRAADQLALIQESLTLMRLVKIYLMDLFNQSRVERQLARFARAQQRRYLGDAVAVPLLIFLGTLAALVLLYVSGRLVLADKIGIASGITLVTALVSLYWPVTNWLTHRRVLRRGRASAAVLFKFLDRPGEVAQVVGAEFVPPLHQRIEFDNVGLREPGTGRMLLRNVTLTIQAGQRIALVGPEETEKHALIYLIPRLLDPTSGEVRLDEHNLRWVTLDSLRAQIGLVMQHNLVFNDTVANNIGCGDPGYTLPQIIEAAKVAHAHQFIQKLPQGYETPIGGLGHSLPVGQQFLIALARALLRDPALLIIEEPLSPLDDDTKALVDDTFARILPNRTTIFLPHRPSTIRACDRIFLLHKGRIEAAGGHRELLEENELYRHLHYIEFHELAEQR